ncbi:hypothetical protein T265_06882 [Opisthorchis viverrini]|uniref:Uncharacterized protein n=1 Tax=Opisthorchis viverrini TaxID=6198 RepID=A0A075ACY4_OPIVI|nr:hypothetical protein T265_06882 [Opisthorchis viverrini]KER25709.1 hypothetical protein T265_06882 [Opisthorchis viverrini]
MLHMGKQMSELTVTSKDKSCDIFYRSTVVSSHDSSHVPSNTVSRLLSYGPGYSAEPVAGGNWPIGCGREAGKTDTAWTLFDGYTVWLVKTEKYKYGKFFHLNSLPQEQIDCSVTCGTDYPQYESLQKKSTSQKRLRCLFSPGGSPSDGLIWYVKRCLTEHSYRLTPLVISKGYP